MRGLRMFHGPTEMLELGVTPHEPGEPPRRSRVQPGVHRARPGYLVDLDRGVEPLDRSQAQRLGHDVAFGQVERPWGNEDGAGHCHLFQACGQMGGLPDRRVVHVEVGAD
jgi:hypothetical protein